MKLNVLSKTLRYGRNYAWVPLIALFFVACLTEVGGERAMTGDCPEGEVCSEQTAAGLVFVGTGFFDDETLRIAPILSGGSFDLGLKTMDGSPLPDFRFEFEDAGHFSATVGSGVFGPTDEQDRPYYTVDSFLQLKGGEPGTTNLRIVDAATGELFDRIQLRVAEIEDVSVINVNDPDREYLQAGSDELLGVRLLVTGGFQSRAVDQDVQLTAVGEIQPENMYWDCFTYTVPSDVSSVTFTATSAGESSTHTFEVR